MTHTPVTSARQIFFGSRAATAEEDVRREKSFFKSLCLPNGTHKTTAPGRLHDVDRLTAEGLAGRESVAVLDVGISSGVTTLELLDHLENRGLATRGVGVDICVRAALHSVLGLDVLYDAGGRVLQVATPLFARGRPDRSQTSLRSRALWTAMRVLELPPMRAVVRTRRGRPIDLVSPRLSARRGFAVVEHDIARPRAEWDQAFDLVRAANILNSSYFPPDQIAVMLTNLTAWLRVGGLLVVCSTSAADGSNHGGLYRKLDPAGRVERVQRLGGGFEHEFQFLPA
jgi:hypothetical protein